MVTNTLDLSLSLLIGASFLLPSSPIHRDEAEWRKASTTKTTLALRFVSLGEPECKGPVDRAWMDKGVETTNKIYQNTNLRFVLDSNDALCANKHGLAKGVVRSRRDRHRLAPFVGDVRIHVFVTGKLMDVDVANRQLRGVHWRSSHGPKGSKVHYVVLSKIAAPRVLAHELGHFFGNAHTTIVGNVMSYAQGKSLPTFRAEQRKRIARNTKRWLRKGKLASHVRDLK